MTCVVTEPCRDCKYTDCVMACPVDAFYQDDRMLYIDPETCIDCGACAAECPVEAIFDEGAVPEQWLSYIQLNLERTQELKRSSGTNITRKQEPLASAPCKVH